MKCDGESKLQSGEKFDLYEINLVFIRIPTSGLRELEARLEGSLAGIVSWNCFDTKREIGFSGSVKSTRLVGFVSLAVFTLLNCPASEPVKRE